jgi:hypothetical protein
MRDLEMGREEKKVGVKREMKRGEIRRNKREIRDKKK